MFLQMGGFLPWHPSVARQNRECYVYSVCFRGCDFSSPSTNSIIKNRRKSATSSSKPPLGVSSSVPPPDVAQEHTRISQYKRVFAFDNLLDQVPADGYSKRNRSPMIYWEGRVGTSHPALWVTSSIRLDAPENSATGAWEVCFESNICKPVRGTTATLQLTHA